MLQLQGELYKFASQPVAFDFETFGLDATDPEQSVRSVAIANDMGCLAIDLGSTDSTTFAYMMEWLSQQRLIAHNYVFDGAWLRKYTGKIVPAHACTLGLFSQLANESQEVSWGLKFAMTEVLGWANQNDEDLMHWLNEQGLKKSDMSLAPFAILGKYNGLDADATWQLYKYFRSLMQVYSWGENLWEFHRQHCKEISLLIRQQFSGMAVDVPRLQSYRAKLEDEMQQASRDFFEHERVAPHVKAYNMARVAEVLDNEPPKLTKTGKEAVRWVKWSAKLAQVTRENHFNIDSPKQLLWLLYDKLGFEKVLDAKTKKPKTDKKAIKTMGDVGRALGTYRNLRTELKYVSNLLELQRDGVFYPQCKSVATISGRLGGGSEGG